MRKLLTLFAALFAGLSLAQASNPDITIGQALAQDENFTTLVSLLDQAGLTEELNAAGPITVLAPSNAVFEGLNQDVLSQITADSDLLHQVLLGHVLQGAYTVNDLQDAEAGTLVTMQGEPLNVATTAGGLTVNETGFNSGNVDNEFSNGFVQGVSYLVIPASLLAQYGPDSELANAEPTDTAEAATPEDTTEATGEDTNTDANAMAQSDMSLIQVLQEDGRFTTLLGLLDQAGLADTLNGSGPFTVFAPTDDAFAAVPQDQLDAIAADPATLERVLLYHVVDSNVLSTDVTDGEVTTMSGDMLNASTENGVMFNQAMVTEADLTANNGTVHVIDQVLLPADLMQ